MSKSQHIISQPDSPWARTQTESNLTNWRLDIIKNNSYIVISDLHLRKSLYYFAGMKINLNNLNDYLNCFLSEAEASLANPNLIQDRFVKLNTHLLFKSQKQDLLITLQARKELSSLLRSTLHYAERSYRLQPVSKELPQVGNLIYYDKKAFKVVKFEDACAILADRVNPKITLTQPVESLRRIENTKVTRRRRTIDFADEKLNLMVSDNYIAYVEWLDDLGKRFKDSAPTQELESSEGRLLVIAPNERETTLLFSDLPSIPFRFCSNSQATASSSCSVFQPIADIYTNFELSDVATLLQMKYKEVVVIGDRNCSKYLSSLIKLRNRGFIERFILIAAVPPETNYSFTEWHWTKEEVNLLQAKALHGEVRFKLTSPYTADGEDNGVSLLKEHFQRIKGCLEDIFQQHNRVRLDKVYFILNEYLRYTLPPGAQSEVAHAFLQHLATSTADFLESEEFKELFYERGVYSQQDIKTASARIKPLFEDLNAFFHSYSPKYAQISNSLKNYEDYEQYAGGRHIIIHNSLLHQARQIPTLHNIDFLVGVAPLFSRNEMKGFDHFVESDLNVVSSQFIFPFILNRAQYETMLEANGDIKLYLYEDIEDFKFQKIREAYERKFMQKIEHTGRASLTACRYTAPEPDVTETVVPQKSAEHETTLINIAQRFYNLNEHDQNFFASLFEVDDIEYDKEKRDYVPLDQTEYNITFTDTETLSLTGFRRVILVEQQREQESLVQIPANQVKPGDTIIVYKNQQKDILYDILLEQDKSGVMREIEQASNLWVSTLKEILRRKGDDLTLVEELLQEQGVHLNYQTLTNYLSKSTKFPKEARTLEAVRQVALDCHLSGSYFTTNAQLQNALTRKAQYHSLTITLGRGVSDEVTHYYFTAQRGKILESLDPEIVEVLRQNIKRGTVKSIEVKK